MAVHPAAGNGLPRLASAAVQDTRRSRQMLHGWRLADGSCVLRNYNRLCLVSRRQASYARWSCRGCLEEQVAGVQFAVIFC